MTAIAYRVYGESNEDENNIEDYMFSVIASDTGAEYLFPAGKEIEGLDSERIERNVLRLYGEAKKPETADDWAEVALYRLGGMVYESDETFETSKEAVKSEKEFALEAEEMRKDLYETDLPETEDITEEEDDQK
jgi:hypothetical protein